MVYTEKKRWLVGSMALSCAFLIGACQTTPANPINPADESKSSSPKPAQQEETRSSSEPEIRYYESIRGKIELPDQPTRVVVANRDYVGDLLALGIQPVGASSTLLFDTSYYIELLEGVADIGADGSVSLEKILELEPELILTYQDDAYESFSKIAPTILIPYGTYDYNDRLLEFGKIMGKEEEAQQRLDEFHQRIDEKKAELGSSLSPDARVAILEITDKDLYLFGKTYGRGGEILYNQLGLSAPEKVEEATEENGWASLSFESVPEYLEEADYILLGVREAGMSRKTDIEVSPLWMNLPAVQAGRVYEYDLNEFYFQDVIALEHQLELLADFLATP